MTSQISDTTARDSRHDVFQCSVKENDQPNDKMCWCSIPNDKVLTAHEQIFALAVVSVVHMIVLLVSPPSSYLDVSVYVMLIKTCVQELSNNVKIS